MSDASIDSLLAEIRNDIQAVLSNRLIGLYLYGSYASGDDTPGVSDLDLLAATVDDITMDEIESLRQMHAAFVRRHPEWDDRVEIAYLSTTALGSFKERRSPLAIISPGEPLHLTDAGKDWLMNWHRVQHGGRVLFGPPPLTFMEPTSDAEFIESLRERARTADSWLAPAKNRKAQSYVVLTLCRTLVALRTGRHSSKAEAAAWVKREYPEWADLVNKAMTARLDPDAGSDVNDSNSLAQTLALLNFTRGLL